MKEMPKQTGISASPFLRQGVGGVEGAHARRAPAPGRSARLGSASSAGPAVLRPSARRGSRRPRRAGSSPAASTGGDAQRLGGLDDGRLHHEHRLRPAEAAEGGEGRQVGAAGDAGGADVGDAVAVGGVEQGALEDRRRQVGGGAGVLVEGHLVGQDRAVGVQADPEVRGVGVALAGQAHVLVAVQHQLDRAAQVRGRQGGQHRPGRGLVLLAAEGAAQARTTSTSIGFMGRPSTRATMRCTTVGDWVAEISAGVPLSPGRRRRPGSRGRGAPGRRSRRGPPPRRRRRGQAASTSPQGEGRATRMISRPCGGGLARVEDRRQLLDLQGDGGERRAGRGAGFRRPPAPPAGRRSGPRRRRAAARRG